MGAMTTTCERGAAHADDPKSVTDTRTRGRRPRTGRRPRLRHERDPRDRRGQRGRPQDV